jgi:hypothetical protein
MKYYAVTDDPRELYHYGVKGMKWGQHIFGDKPKSPGYHRASRKLKSLMSKTSSSLKSVGKAAQKSVAQISYDLRKKQDARYQQRVQKSQDKFDKKMVKLDSKIDNYFANKPVKDAKRAAAINSAKNNIAAIGSTIKKAPGQIAYNIRKQQDSRYEKAVQKAQARNNLSKALSSLDKEDKYRKQIDRERKMESLRERQADVQADNDLKALSKAVRAEKHMPKYMQEARTGMLKYGKLSEDQIGRVQERLALEAQTRRLGSTEAPSWRQQKKAARREGYLQGITKGISAGMEEVGRASVQYGIKNLANRKKMDNASELKAEREKTANRIKNKKTRSEMRGDFKQDVYNEQLKAGVKASERGVPWQTSRKAAQRLQEAKRIQNENQGKLEDANAERKFLMDEKHDTIRTERKNKLEDARAEQKFLTDETHNKIRNERERQERLSEDEEKVKRIGEQMYKYGFAVLPQYNKDGKFTGYMKYNADGSIGKDKAAAGLGEIYKQDHDRAEAERQRIEAEAARERARAEAEAKAEKQRQEHDEQVKKDELRRQREAREARKETVEAIRIMDKAPDRYRAMDRASNRSHPSMLNQFLNQLAVEREYVKPKKPKRRHKG